MLEVHRQEWDEVVELSLKEKLGVLQTDFKEVFSSLFSWREELSMDIDFDAFASSHFVQPDVFLRIRSNQKEKVKRTLNEVEIPFKEITSSTFSVEANSKVDRALQIDSDVVVQDLSSQRVGDFLSKLLKEDTPKVWDCCAGSGGKSIMAYDINPKIRLTVSDVRENILINLKKRFDAAGIKSYKSFQLDLGNGQSVLDSPFDVIIADVPCTGSGTWGRTPEQLTYFEASKIQEYADLQRTIVSNAIPLLKPGGFLVYITCSVFKKENENNVEYLIDEFDLEEVDGGLLKGYDQKADSMFVSVLKRACN